MTWRAGSVSDRSTGSSAAVGALIDDLAARMQAGEPVDLDEFLAEHPEQADELRQLLPALQVLADVASFGESRAAHEVSDASGVLGDFRIIREVGRGGMGIVYEAEQISLGRRVALKVLPFAATLDPRQLTRFQNEAKAAASLYHEHIVHVYGVGCERGVHFFAMQFVDGYTLADVITVRETQKRHSTPGVTPNDSSSVGASDSPEHDTVPIALLSTERTGPRSRELYHRCAGLIADAADALEHAHSLGIVHRDVKPGNLLLDAGGKVYVSDFGLARFGLDAGPTMSGDLLGTLRYMAPEQALARHGLADHRVDVYGLGCTLYELLTGKPAVGGEDKADILRRIAFEEPVALRKLNRTIPAELETISLKCIAKEPAERYATAGELAADLRRWLEDKPIKARRPTMRQRFGRWARKHPAVSAAIGLIAGVVVVGSWAWHREAMHADRAAHAMAAEADQLRDADRLPEALRAARHAADLLPRFGGDAALRREVGERVADLQLLIRLDDARLEGAVAGSDGAAFDYKRKAQLYRQAFLEFGVDVVEGDEEAVIQALRRRAIADRLLVVLFDWTRETTQAGEKQRLGRLIRALDADPRAIVSGIYEALDAKNTWMVKRLADDAAADPHFPTAALGVRLAEERSRDGWPFMAEAEALLRTAQSRNPADFWANHHLAFLLVQKGRPAEAIEFYRAAVALRPQSAGAWINFGGALYKEKRYAEAEEVDRRAIEIKPDYAEAYANSGMNLVKMGRKEDAEIAFRRAIEIKPDLVGGYAKLGNLLHETGRDAESEALFVDRAIKRGPGTAKDASAAGMLLRNQGRLVEAETLARDAVERWPKDALTWQSLGAALENQAERGDRAKGQEAVGVLRRAITLKPDLAFAHVDLGKVLILQNDLKEGMEAIQKSMTLDRSVCRICISFGVHMGNQGMTARATQVLAAALAGDPTEAERDNGARYAAASFAVLAGSGQGKDAVKLDDSDRGHLRRQALDLLVAEAAAEAKRAKIPASRSKVRQHMQLWQTDSNLSAVRKADALAKLPAAEQAAWRKLWSDVGELLKSTDGPIPAAEAPP
jgi:serine/threonine protein kinase/Flp pilus assembly protein TadD